MDEKEKKKMTGDRIWQQFTIILSENVYDSVSHLQKYFVYNLQMDGIIL